LAKIRVSITIDKKLVTEIEQVYRKRLKKALNKNEEKLPKLANLYEEILLLGWDIFQKEKRE
jgi:hypothetical protein